MNDVYRAKSDEVHVFEYTGKNFDELIEWAISHGLNPDDREKSIFKSGLEMRTNSRLIGINTALHNTIWADSGDMIICGPDGQFFSIDPKRFSYIFEKGSVK